MRAIGASGTPVKYLASEVKNLNLDLEEHNLLSLSYGRIIRKDIESNEGLLPASFERYTVVRPGDVVLRLTDLQNDQRSLRTGLVKEPGIITSAYLTLRPQSTVDSRYFAYALHAVDVAKAFYTLGGGLRQSMGMEEVGGLRLALPPLEEQRRIADFLDENVGHIAKIMELRRREVEILETSRRDALLELIFAGRESTYRSTGIEWLPKIPASWGFVRARFLCDITTGSGDTVDAVDEGEFPFYVRSDRPERSSEFTFDTEAVLTSGDGAGVGKVFHHVVGKFHAHQRVYVLHNFRGVFPRYFFHYFSATFGKVALDGSAKSTVDSVRRDMLAELPVPLPHIAAQKAISAEVDDQLLKWREAQQALKESIGLLDEYRRSLITAAATGELDVTTARRGIPA